MCLSQHILKDGQYYAVVDNKVITLGNNLIPAFDILYKRHHVFNIKYDVSLSKFYNFFDVFIYKIKGVNPLGLTTSFKKKISALSV